MFSVDVNVHLVPSTPHTFLFSVGLGAQFLSQNAYESRRNPENTIKGMLKRKSGQEEEEAASGSTTKGGAADSDDEETQRGGGSSRKAARIDPFAGATNHAIVKSQKLKSGKSVLEADYASRKASKKKKKKKKKKQETSEQDTTEKK
ncbi:hypothetical protein SARC_06892 [Sphaeroforma arctica JP610]|uniref:Uncharacterized protein n=1 Tax=Sphaeroforma arctica JP610 TaxID=667725 RepID=A0A0L0FV88_9EUKA|nr:hypothetical protein SARC_06892 [Sphaeroforma arctica JP610]KNC80765.1 hypothetical protein SARC_06892 [Sphaeroforma arctica JP610]|eukprot:XP_014154667.1 hypothetical protein SARC_06892 [Sphaeroforma arctica JP610]